MFFYSKVFLNEGMHPSLQLKNLLNPFQGHGETTQLLLGKGGVHTEQAASQLQGHTLTHVRTI